MKARFILSAILLATLTFTGIAKDKEPKLPKCEKITVDNKLCWQCKLKSIKPGFVSLQLKFSTNQWIIQISFTHTDVVFRDDKCVLKLDNGEEVELLPTGKFWPNGTTVNACYAITKEQIEKIIEKGTSTADIYVDGKPCLEIFDKNDFSKNLDLQYRSILNALQNADL